MQTTVPRGRTYYMCVSWLVGLTKRFGSTYLGSLLEWLLVDGHQDDSMRAKTILSSGLDIFDHVLAGREVHESGGSELLETHLLLLFSAVNSDGPQTHGFGVLLSQGSKPTTCTDNRDCLTRLRTRLLQTLVYSDTGTEHRSDRIERNVFV